MHSNMLKNPWQLCEVTSKSPGPKLQCRLQQIRFNFQFSLPCDFQILVLLAPNFSTNDFGIFEVFVWLKRKKTQQIMILEHFGWKSKFYSVFIHWILSTSAVLRTQKLCSHIPGNWSLLHEKQCNNFLEMDSSAIPHLVNVTQNVENDSIKFFLAATYYYSIE